jgi:hypothetical protein
MVLGPFLLTGMYDNNTNFIKYNLLLNLSCNDEVNLGLCCLNCRCVVVTKTSETMMS